MNNAIQPGDRVILGCKAAEVLYVLGGDVVRVLYVEGRDGQRWWARAEGARVLPREPEGNAFSSRYGDW